MMMQFVDHHGFLTPIELFLEPFGVALCLHLATSVFRPWAVGKSLSAFQNSTLGKFIVFFQVFMIFNVFSCFSCVLLLFAVLGVFFAFSQFFNDFRCFLLLWSEWATDG